MNDITVLGIDLAKTIFQLHGVNAQGKVVYKRQVRRNKLAETVNNLPCCLIGMEACGGAHYWARKFKVQGHEVKLMGPQYVKPYVKTNKNDQNDAEAICEAVTRPTMRYVPIKAVEQQDIQMVHRIRSRLVGNKTALSNQIRGLLQEYGIVVPVGDSALRKRLTYLCGDEKSELTEMTRNLFCELYEEYLVLVEEIKKYAERLETLAKTDERSHRLMEIKGLGPITATALAAAVGDVTTFKKGRQMSAWLGLVPRQNSSGGKIRLGGISKRGDSYLRALLVHGARSVVTASARKSDPRSQWIQRLVTRCGFNKAVVAVANKNVRIAWAILFNETRFDVNYSVKST